jgi:hypothetical protein
MSRLKLVASKTTEIDKKLQKNCCKLLTFVAKIYKFKILSQLFFAKHSAVTFLTAFSKPGSDYAYISVSIQRQRRSIGLKSCE